jgi:hypothetical protein
MAQPQLQIKGGKRSVNLAMSWLRGWAPPPEVAVEMLKSIRNRMNMVMGMQFIRLRRGGSARGVSWADFKPQYRRKTDGMVVPAWGGVRRLRGGSDTVRPRRRPSGRFLTPQSNLMQDTGRLRATRADVSFLSPKQIRFGPTVSYAGYQNSLRPFAFFKIPEDVKATRDEAFETFRRLMPKASPR